MPKLPRGITQNKAVRALMDAGGTEKLDRGKGSHRAVLMPNGHLAIIPMKVKPGLLMAQIKLSGLTLEEFLKHL